MNDSLLTAGREAASRGDWTEAYDLLVHADGRQVLRADELALLAEVAYAAGHVDVTISTWERAHAEGVRAGDLVMAAGAAMRVAMHLLFDAALMAPVRGWASRAERLLQAYDETPVHAWLAVVRAYERLLSGDFSRACDWARRAIDIGSRRDPAAAAIGRIAEARARILAGDVEHGLALLDEAAVATVSGELDAFLTGVVYCELVCALQALAQYDRAEEWTEAMERWRHGQAVGSIHGRCRVHRAEILRLRGASSEAEQEAMLACEELRPYLRREFGWPLTELGRIRLWRGELDGAEEAFLAAHQAGWDPQPGLAMVQFARGDVALAAASIRDALDHPAPIPSKELPPNTALRRAPLLEAQVEIAIEEGDIVCARGAAAELGEVAAAFHSKSLVASAAHARAQVLLAERDATGARLEFQAAMHLWNDVGAPYACARARMGIARAFEAEGDTRRAMMEARAARATFEEIGAKLEATRATSLCGADERRRDDPAAVIFQQEGDYWSVTFGGRTTRLRDMKGMRYLCRLLADPGRDFHVLDLVNAERGPTDSGDTASSAADLGDAGTMLDAPAKDAYRRRLAEIEEDIQEARSVGDIVREAQAEAERDFLLRELSRAVGLGGRDRRAGSASERARVSVTRAVRAAISRIREHDVELGAYLDGRIRTGTCCLYRKEGDASRPPR